MDIYIECANCGKEFVFTEGEQRSFESKGFAPPKRCKACRGKVNMRHSEGRTSNYFENAQIYGPGVSVEGGVSIEHSYCVHVKGKGYAFLDEDGRIRSSKDNRHFTHWDAARKLADRIDELGYEYTIESEPHYDHYKE